MSHNYYRTYNSRSFLVRLSVSPRYKCEFFKSSHKHRTIMKGGYKLFSLHEWELPTLRGRHECTTVISFIFIPTIKTWNLNPHSHHLSLDISQYDHMLRNQSFCLSNALFALSISLSFISLSHFHSFLLWLSLSLPHHLFLSAQSGQ